MVIKVEFDVWNGKKWLTVDTTHTEEISGALGKLYELHNAAVRVAQEQRVRVVITWQEVGG